MRQSPTQHPACLAGQVSTAALVPGTGGTAVDIFSASDYLDINSTEGNSDTGDTGTIDTSNDDLATGDFLEVTVTAVSTTKPKGLIITLEARKP